MTLLQVNHLFFILFFLEFYIKFIHEDEYQCIVEHFFKGDEPQNIIASMPI
jgi:hypothetical protein